jgi:hypothetical protein
VPLSDHEQRILDEIEKNLSREDPRLARDARSVPKLTPSSRLKLGAVLFAVGFAALLAFFLSQHLVVGVLAFAAMVGGIVLAAGSFGGIAAGGRSRKEGMTRLFEDWEERIRRRTKRD